MVIAIIASMLVLIVLAFLLHSFPTGDQVRKSYNFRLEIEQILEKSELVTADGENVVMSKEFKRGVGVVIKNPKPSSQKIFDLIYRNRQKFQERPLVIIFKDQQMNIIDKRIIK